jgi:DNA-binding response OmpR family regulator
MAYTILAIDDTKRILDIIKYFLENEGYIVKAATDGESGIKLAQEGGIDMVLLDIMMPGLDGYAVCERLKKDSKTKDLPVIMLTAKAIIMHTPKDFFYGLYGFLAKPFSKDQLLKVVGDTLRITKTPPEQRFISPLESPREEIIP